MSSNTTIPVEELELLTERVEREKPYDVRSYRIRNFHRRYFCTILTAFLALGLMPTIGSALILIAIVLAFDIYMSQHAYDQTLPDRELVQMMYRAGDQPWIKKGAFKRYTYLYISAFVVLSALVCFTKLEWLPTIWVKYIMMFSFIALSMYSSYACVRMRLAKGLFEEPTQYARQGKMFDVLSNSPLSMFYFFLAPDMKRAVSDWTTSCFGFLWLSLAINFLHKGPELPWEGFIVFAMMPIASVLWAWIYPAALFMEKCICIDRLRLSTVSGESK